MQVSNDGLRVDAGWCEALVGKLAGNCAPTGAAAPLLGSAAAISAAHIQVAAAGMRCTLRGQVTAAKLATAATGYAANEVSSTAQLRALDIPKVC